MRDWVECVPNFSEGRRPEVVEALAAAIHSVPDVYLLAREMDTSHNRSVFTLAGPPRAVLEAALAAVRTARDRIDLNKHQGEHPRIGATDVVPFIPLGDTPMTVCVELARELGRRIWEELGIPTYLYEEAATRPDRRELSVLRKGEFEGLREEIKTNAERRPDFGDSALHATAGATAVGARWFLIAFNVYLNTNNLEVAREIARNIRFSSGGFRYVKAMGFAIQDRDQVQVSMNLINYRGTSIPRVVEFIRREAARHGVAVSSSEIVGLVPQEALNMASEYYLQLERFTPDQILEERIRQALRAAPTAGPTLAGFLDDLASPQPAPGGGSAAALAGALAASLGVMVSDLTLSREKFRDSWEGIRPHLAPLQKARADLLQLLHRDAAAYERVVAAYRLPREGTAQKQARNEAIESALREATVVPLQTAEMAAAVLQSLQKIAGLINPNAVSDLGVAGQAALASGKGALFNVRVNLGSLPDGEFKDKTRARSESLRSELEESAAAVERFVLERL